MNDFYSDDDICKVKSWGAEFTCSEFAKMYADNVLVKPEIEENYAWNHMQSSRFIESILLGFPVTNMFMTMLQDGSRLLIDGFQKVRTIHDYIVGKFRLSQGNEINKRWRGKSFSDLYVFDQRKILKNSVHTVIFEQERISEKNTSLYQIFERIRNTLTSQEIRNCVYRGNLNTALIQLNKNEDWRTLLGNDEPDSKMRDIEYILRFLYLVDTIDSLKEDILFTKELNIFMGAAKNNTQDAIERFTNIFERTMDSLVVSLGANAFYENHVFHPAIFDSIAVCYAKQNSVIKRDLREQKELLLKEPVYLDAIAGESAQDVYIRYALAKKYLFVE